MESRTLFLSLVFPPEAGKWGWGRISAGSEKTHGESAFQQWDGPTALRRTYNPFSESGWTRMLFSEQTGFKLVPLTNIGYQ